MKKACVSLLAAFLCLFSFAQTPVPMASQPGLSYTENFADIAAWTNSFASGIGANRFSSVAVNATGTIPDGVRITTATTNFVTGTSGGVQRGTSQTPSTQSIVLLSTGTTDNTSSAAIDFFMDFTGVNAGTLSFDWAVVFNSTGDRKGSLRVYASTDGTTFTEISAAQVLNFTNNVAGSGSITSVALPASFNNSATARLRFYYHNGAGAATAGSRPKISIDNLNVTAIATGNSVSASAAGNAAEPATNGSFNITFNAATTGSTDVNYDFTGSAGFGTDYTISFSAGVPSTSTASGTLTVPAGTSVVTVTVTPVDDGDVEGTETISLGLSAPTGGYSIGTGSAAIDLGDNDVAPTVSIAAGTNAAEPATNGTFNVTLSNPAPAGGVTITYTLGGNATAGTDYTDPQSGSITITSGNTGGVITLNTNDDPDTEGLETISITLNTVSSPYVVGAGNASINLTDNDTAPLLLSTSYSQDFNTLSATGTNNPWTDNTTIAGWYATRLTYNAGNGGSNAGALYSFGETSATDRALGSVGSGSTGTIFYGARFKNNTGTNITALKITYTGEQWRNGGVATAQTVNFAYQSGATITSLTTGTWTPVANLNFTSLVGSTTAAALNGNLIGTNAAIITYTINGLNIPPNDEIMIRWEDIDHSGSDHGLGIDDFTIEANPVDVTAPAIVNLSPANGATDVSTNIAATITFNETIQKGTGNIVVRRTSDNSIFQTIDITSPSVIAGTTSITFNLAGLAVNTGYYVEIDNGAVEDVSGNDFPGISGSGGWSFTTGITFYTANFNSCTSSLSDGFTQFSVVGPTVWGCTTFGRDPMNPAGNAPFPNGVQINGFAAGTNIPNVDWFISPSFNLTGTTFPLLSFWSRTAFNGASLQLKVSTDYVSGDPSTATWTDINGKFPNQASNIWTLSENINLTAFKGANVHFAFVYTSSDEDGARWTLDDISIGDSPVPPPPSLTVGTTDIQFTFVASGNTADKTFTFIGNDLTDDVTLTATGNFLLSKDGISFSPAISYTQAEANNVTQTVHVRFAPNAPNQNYTGTVTVSTGSLDETINLKGTSIDPLTTLEVLNWNIEWFGSPVEDPVNDAQQEQNVKTILTNVNADVFALSEIVNETRLASVVSQMPGYAYVLSDFGSHTNTTVNPPGNLALAQKLAFVYKTSVVSNVTTTPLLSQGSNSAADISSNPAYNYWSSGRFPYMMSADVTLNCITKHIKFILVHAKANTSPTATSYARRKDGADTLHYVLQQMFPNDNIIILGDFNDDLDQSVTAGFTTTSWDAFTTDNTNYSALTLPLSLAGKKSTVGHNDVIDHVVVSNEMSTYYMDGSANILTDVAGLVSNYGGTTSDHYPVFTRYQFEQPAAPGITCPGDIEKGSDAGICGAIVEYTVNYQSNCGAGTLQQTTGLPSGAVFPVGITTNTFVVTDGAGNTATCSFTVTITDNQAPVITCPANVNTGTDAGTCGAVVNYNVAYSDNCAGADILQTAGLASGSVFPVGTTLNTFLVADASGNMSSCSFTVTVTDNQAPTFTRPADITIPFTGACDYNAGVGITGDVTNEEDNCATGLNATYTDAVANCGNDIIITRTWTLTDGTNAATPQVQTIRVTDNNTSYVVYALKAAMFGENNYINGSVGVISYFGEAEFKKGTQLLAPYFAKAKHIDVKTGATVQNRIFTMALDGPMPQFSLFNGSTGNLPSRTISMSTAIPVSANYRELRIKKNVTVTITGTLYGKIIIEEGADVTFSPVGGILNIETLEITGETSNATDIRFGNCTAVRIKTKVTIDKNVQFNTGGPRVTFYLGDFNIDEEKFIVRGGKNNVTANVFLLNGTLKVEGTSTSMTTMNGWFISESVVSEGKNVTWNSNNCSSSASKSPLYTQVTETGTPVAEASALTVDVLPNPSSSYFTLQIRSTNDAPVTVRITDQAGRVVYMQQGVAAISNVKAGQELKTGVYFAEVVQGGERKVVKLVKL